MTYSFLIISSLCMKLLSILLFQLTVMPFSCSFFCINFVQSPVPAVPTFIQKFRTNFFCSITFKNVQIFHRNSILITETHVYTKPFTLNHQLLPSYTRSVFKLVSKLTKEGGLSFVTSDRPKFVFVFDLGPKNDEIRWFRPFSFLDETVLCVFISRFIYGENHRRKFENH